jgi:hypothetical protein
LLLLSRMSSTNFETLQFELSRIKPPTFLSPISSGLFSSLFRNSFQISRHGLFFYHFRLKWIHLPPPPYDYIHIWTASSRITFQKPARKKKRNNTSLRKNWLISCDGGVLLLDGRVRWKMYSRETHRNTRTKTSTYTLIRTQNGGAFRKAYIALGSEICSSEKRGTHTHSLGISDLKLYVKMIKVHPKSIKSVSTIFTCRCMIFLFVFKNVCKTNDNEIYNKSAIWQADGAFSFLGSISPRV